MSPNATNHATTITLNTNPEYEIELKSVINDLINAKNMYNEAMERLETASSESDLQDCLELLSHCKTSYQQAKEKLDTLTNTIIQALNLSYN